MLKIKMESQFEEETIQDIFEGYDVKFSKAKITKLKKLLVETLEENPDLLEEFLEELMGEIIQEEWG